MFWGGLLPLLGWALLVGCTSPFQKARQVDTVQAYKEFLRKNPNSPERAQALRRLDRLMYDRAVSADSIDSYSLYLQEFPRGRFRRRAKRRREALSYRTARRRDRLKSYQEFLEQYPNGQYARDAKDRIELLFYQKAKRYQSYRGMDAYLKHFPRGRFRREATENFRRFWWERIAKKPTVEKIDRWLQVFQSGDYVSQARRKRTALQYMIYEDKGQWWLIRKWMKQNPNSPLFERAKKNSRILRRAYPRFERARRLMEAGDTQRATQRYRYIYRSFRRNDVVMKLLQRDLKKYKITDDVIR